MYWANIRIYMNFSLLIFLRLKLMWRETLRHSTSRHIKLSVDAGAALRSYYARIRIWAVSSLLIFPKKRLNQRTQIIDSFRLTKPSHCSSFFILPEWDMIDRPTKTVVLKIFRSDTGISELLTKARYLKGRMP